MIDLRIEAPLPPKGKGRPRVALRAGRAHAYTPAPTRRWEAQLALMAQAQIGGHGIIDEPVRVAVIAVVPRPGRLMRKKDPDGFVWCGQRPDADNYLKAALDALESFWRDDSLVVDATAIKVYAERTGRPRVIVRISSATDQPETRIATVLGDAA